MRAPRVTLLQVFAGSIVAIAVLLAALLLLFVTTTRRSILQSAEALRGAVARYVDDSVREELHGASRAADGVERALRLGLADPDDPRSIEAICFGELVRNPHLAEVTFTRADRTGFDANGDVELAAAGRWQASVVRLGGGAVATRLVHPGGGGFVVERRDRPQGGGIASAPLQPQGAAPDPTEHLTFRTAASREFDGTPIWTDLSWAQSDAALPVERRRVVVSVQKSVLRADGRFAGVVRAGLLTDAVDAIAAIKVDQRRADDPHRVFLADPQGRLVTRLLPSDPLVDAGDALRVRPPQLPPAIAAALSSPALAQASGEDEERSADLDVAGERWLATFRRLPDTQDWLVGIVVPESAYTSGLRALQMRFLLLSVVLAGVALIGGAAALVALRRSLGQIVATTSRMRQLDFKASPAEAPFRDVQEVVDGLERAKTAVRALGKYVPIDLVRKLYRGNVEPALGGEVRELTLLFTDLEGFTGLSERLSPDELARALGAYLETMTSAIRATSGTIDKFIGDAVMAFWNAPEPNDDHARLACAAVLACKEATRALYESPSWTLPRLRTRFGLHLGEAMVGHFGAPERLSYTALGDVVNLASRLEGLCKQYGVDVIVSDAVVERARAEFAFRVVDRVAVKGRTQGILVYELLGRAPFAVPQAVHDYEAAFAAYLRRDFSSAAALLAQHAADGPSRVLFDRCRALAAEPPPAGWNGVHVATTK